MTMYELLESANIGQSMTKWIADVLSADDDGDKDFRYEYSQVVESRKEIPFAL